MRVVPDSLAGRTITLLLVGIVSVHLVSVWIYDNRVSSSGEEIHAAEHILVAARALSKRPAEERPALAEAISSNGIAIQWSPLPSVSNPDLPEARLKQLRRVLAEVEPEGSTDWLRAAAADRHGPDPDAPLRVSVALPDGSWLNVVATGVNLAAGHLDIVGSTTAMAAGVALVSIFLIRSLTEPFRLLANAAHRLGTDMFGPLVPERGPREQRQVAAAFNEMQGRIRRLIEDRTQTLAAISHDLKTPITRLRLRAEFIKDEALKRKVISDLDEMETMITSTLAFLRSDSLGETSRPLDLAELLASICDEVADAGNRATYSGPRHAPVEGRPVALKRAFSNLIDNAVKYGAEARVSLQVGSCDLEVMVQDDGPGIDPALHDDVFAPFYRIETSRNRATGGTGLGLTVARTIIRGHGGDVRLENEPEGTGLRALATLPQTPKNDD